MSETNNGGLVGDGVMKEAVERLVTGARPRFARLWTYYRNPLRVCAVGADQQGSDRPYRQGQEWGMPSRITGLRSGCEVGAGGMPVEGVARKEVVVENDIGWRVDTMVDYLFGKAISLHSAAEDAGRRQEIGELLRLVIAHNGGILFLQQMALIGAVYGYVDVVVKFDAGAAEEDGSFSGVQELGEPAVATEGDGGASASEGQGFRNQASAARLRRAARMIRLEIVEPARALPFCSAEDWRTLEAYGQVYEVAQQEDVKETQRRKGWLGRMLAAAGGERGEANVTKKRVVEMMTAARWQRWEDGVVVAEGANSLGVLPVVHVQNMPLPFRYEGASDVEPLVPLQDELNTRLSDRANRITMQSFKMYLGKSVDGFTEAAVGPGRMWATDNPDADVIEFGGDASSPSEDNHIADLREALDKCSGVSPVAAGAIKNRIGNLTSGAALRITLFALLSKNERKRTTYGGGLQRICELALAWLDHAGVYRTAEEERRVEIHWPSPLPENELESLQEAETKLRIGVAKETVLRELGY